LKQEVILNKKKVYVIGHKNPDTDSIVSAVAYAELKRATGQKNCFPARAGKINLQTEYILKRFSISKPEFLSDLIPKVCNYMTPDPITVTGNTPLWKALELLNNKNHKMLPIVDEENRFHSILHYNAFAQNMLKKINPHKKSIITTSISHLISTLNAQPLVVNEKDKIFKSQIIVAASEIDTVKEFVNSIPPENTIIIVGDRKDIHKYVIDKKVKCLIITGGKPAGKDITDMAIKNGVSIIISPFDTSTTSLLTFYSTPVIHMGDESIDPVKEDKYIKHIRENISASTSKSLPVIDEDNRVIGVISQEDLMNEPNIDIIMVDHNELTQAAEGIENYKILEIIDHHRLGNLHTTYPITFINKPVGSTSTIIASLYEEKKVPLKKEIASILLAGILSDTLILRSATTTDVDMEMAQYLSDITGLHINDFGTDILNAASMVSSKPMEDILNMDLKKYTHDKKFYTISQVEVNSLDELMDRRDEILGGLEKIRSSENSLFSTLMVTDITELNSLLFISGSNEIIREIQYHKLHDKTYMLKDILSRKKQLMPYLTELIKKIN